MNSSWYRTYFAEDYWRFNKPQFLAERTATEIEYLQRVLKEAAPGRRVVDLGCGVGRHAVGLARAGFEMTELDVSEWAIDTAIIRSCGAGVDIRWEVVDLLKEETWPLSENDAAICVDSFGWGSDTDQRRLLRRIRRYLVPNGLLILALPNLLWVTRHLIESFSSAVGDIKYLFQQKYDPGSGRIRGSLTSSASDKQVLGLNGSTEYVLSYDMRLYSTTELISLIQETGFVIERLEADFKAHCPVSLDSRYIQVWARKLPTPPASLAVTSWRAPPDRRLDLRYEPDEAKWLDPSPSSIWEALLHSESQPGADAAVHYPVDDPYGSERAAAVVSEHFCCAIPHHQLTLGPGVTSLLHDLCGLADGGLILGPQLVHPDLTAWGAAQGHEVSFVQEPAELDQFIDEIHAQRPSLVHLDRPKLFAGELISLDDLYTLCAESAQVGAVVLVDESPANYLGPAASAVRLIHRLDNLVVLRGMTKAYSWGGIRVGFAYASNSVSAKVRDLVCPLQVGELSLRAALLLLAAGDIFHQLRARITEVKADMINLLRSTGLEVIEGHPALPWVNLPDVSGETLRWFDHLGVRGLQFAPSPALRGPYPERLLLFSPLSDERMSMLRECLEGASTGIASNAPLAQRTAALQESEPDR